MNEIQLKILEDLFAMVPKGAFRDIEQLQEFIEDEGVEELFEMVPEGVFEDEEQFTEFITPLKKKDFSGDGPQQPVDSGMQTPTDETPLSQGPGSSATPDRTVDRLTPQIGSIQTQQDLPDKPVGTKFGANSSVILSSDKAQLAIDAEVLRSLNASANLAGKLKLSVTFRWRDNRWTRLHIEPIRTIAALITNVQIRG